MLNIFCHTGKQCRKYGMQRKKFLMVLLLCAVVPAVRGQQGYTWWNPATAAFPVVDGLLPGSTYFLPGQGSTAARNTSTIANTGCEGLYIKFTTNARDIIIRYSLQRPPVAATGSSQQDAGDIHVYAIDHDGNWWPLSAEVSARDTMVYRYAHLSVDTAYKNGTLEFRLFLPQSAVQWMEIGLPANSQFAFLPVQPEKPVVLFSATPTAQLKNAFPGPGYVAVLERIFDRPFVRVALPSGGLHRPQLAAARINAKLFVLEGWAAGTAGWSNAALQTSLLSVVRLIRQQHPAVPVLLVGPPPTQENKTTLQQAAVVEAVFAALQKQHVQNIHILTAGEIQRTGIPSNGQQGEQYAQQYLPALEQAIRNTMHEAAGSSKLTRPVVQSRDGWYNWRQRHAAVLAMNKVSPPQNVLLGNSIVHYWGGLPQGPFGRDTGSWNTCLQPLGVRNMGFGWDKIENVLWRIYHDELDGYSARHVMLMIGTNNLSGSSDEEIINGLQWLVQAVRVYQPRAAIVLSGLLPRRGMELRVEQLNSRMAQLAVSLQVQYINPGKLLLNSTGKIDEGFFTDGLHPNAAGYGKIAPVLAAAMKE
jgi:lysophospholipase L1-like esterase